MSERRSPESDFPVPINFDANAVEVAAGFPSAPTAEQLRWAHAMVPVHGTTLADAVKIIQSGTISSYAALGVRPKPNKISPHLTDSLDIEMGQHAYTFWNVGKTSPVMFSPIYFCAKPALVRRSDSYVAMHDVADFGALVSSEGQRLWQAYHPQDDIDERNRQAVSRFFRSLLRGKDFGDIFGKFLATYYPDIENGTSRAALEYWNDVTFPGIQLTLETLGNQIVTNAWAGPQLQTRGRVSLSDVHTIIITDPQIKSIPGLKQSKYRHIQVAHGEKMADAMRYSAGPYGGIRGDLDSMQQSLYTNMIIRSLTTSFL